MVTRFLRKGSVLLLACLIVFFIAVSGALNALPAAANSSAVANVVALPGYDIDVFAQGNASYSNPDSIDVAGKYVYVGYQNITAKDGTDNKTSTIVQYTKDGKVVHTFTVLGHCDGLRFNPYTKLLWATSNEDGNPRIVTINPDTGVITPYVFPPTPHGGGYDDVIFVNGNAFIAASNPTLDSSGVNVFPAVDEITLSKGKAVLTPILNGNATATDLVTNQQVTLNMTDPDSQSLDNQGNLVQDDQADGQLVFLHNPGTAQQTVSRLLLGTQVDDTLWIPAANEGHMLVVDGKTNTIYSVSLKQQDFSAGTVYTEAPSDSGVASFVGTLDLTTGTITPVIIGLVHPTGLAFMPN